MTDALTSGAASVVGIAAALGSVGWIVRRGWRFIRLSVHAFETIQRELSPNGGGSTYDLVRRLKEQSDDHADRLDALEVATRSAGQAAEAAVGQAHAAASAAAEAEAEARGARAYLAASDARTSEQISKAQGAIEALERGVAFQRGYRATDPAPVPSVPATATITIEGTPT